MGRPKVFTPWATGNYAAGGDAWSGTAKRIANGGRCFVPKVLSGPQEVNDAIGECIDNDNAILASLGVTSAQNWLSVNATVPGSITPLAMAGDPKFGRMAIFGTTGTNLVQFTKNGGRTWATAGGAQSGTSSAAIRGIVFNPTTGQCAVAVYPAAGAVSAVTDEQTRLGLAQSTGVITGIYFNGLYIFAGRDGSSNVLKTSNGSPTFSDYSGSVPSGWNTALSYFAASSGSKLMIVSGLSSDNHFLLTSDGATWTNTGTFTLPGGYFLEGFDYAGDRWVIAMTNGTDSKVYTSIDNGVTWVLASTLTGIVLGGMAALGTLIFATQTDSRGLRGIYSIDGGVTWTAGTNWDGGGADRVYSASGRGFFTISGTTGAYGVSHLMP